MPVYVVLVLLCTGGIFSLPIRQNSRLMVQRATHVEFNPLSTKLYLSKDPVRTAQKTLSTSVIKTDKLKLYREIISVCSEIHAKHVSVLWAEHRISEC